MALFAGSALATSASSYNTNFTAVSTNSSMTTSAGTISCTTSTITGRTPAGPATVLSSPITLSYSGCTAFGLPATVTVSGNCLTLQVKYNTASDIPVQIIIPAGCSITIHIPAIGCTLVISGPATVNLPWNSTIEFVNGAPSRVIISSAAVNYNRTAGGFGCPASGTATLNGTYNITSSPNITVGP